MSVASDGRKKEEEGGGWLEGEALTKVMVVPNVPWLLLEASVPGTGLLSVEMVNPSVAGSTAEVAAAGLSGVPVVCGAKVSSLRVLACWEDSVPLEALIPLWVLLIVHEGCRLVAAA